MSTLAAFNWVDYVVLLIFLLSIISGIFRGFISEVIGLLFWIIAFAAGILYSTPLAHYFFASHQETSASSAAGSSEALSLLAIGLSFICIFILVILIGRLVSFLLTYAISGAGLGIGNRSLGGIFGLARGFLLVVLIMFLVNLSSVASEPWWDESYFVNWFKPAVQWLSDHVHPGLNDLKTKVQEQAKTQEAS